MPRYFVHVRPADGPSEVRDVEVVDLEGPREAQAHAIRRVAEILAEADPPACACTDHRVEVLDEAGRPICGLQVEGWLGPRGRPAPGRDLARAWGIRLRP